MLAMKELISNSDMMELTYSYFKSEKAKPCEYKKMKRYLSFTEILKEIDPDC